MCAGVWQTKVTHSSPACDFERLLPKITLPTQERDISWLIDGLFEPGNALKDLCSPPLIGLWEYMCVVFSLEVIDYDGFGRKVFVETVYMNERADVTVNY